MFSWLSLPCVAPRQEHTTASPPTAAQLLLLDLPLVLSWPKEPDLHMRTARGWENQQIPHSYWKSTKLFILDARQAQVGSQTSIQLAEKAQNPFCTVLLCTHCQALPHYTLPLKEAVASWHWTHGPGRNQIQLILPLKYGKKKFLQIMGSTSMKNAEVWQ